MQIQTFKGGYDENFSYLVWEEGSREAVLVDAATPVEPIRSDVEKHGLTLPAVLLTHTHLDHWAYLDALEENFPGLDVMGFKRPVSPVGRRYVGLDEGESVGRGGLDLVLRHTPGHYPDSVCWFSPGHGVLFTGDTVFIGRTGRTIGPGSDLAELYQSLYGTLLQLPPETIVYPGHDYGPSPTATLGELKRDFAFFQCADFASFSEVMAAFERTRKI